ncbi:hypothetical protein RB2414 [Rhodopirellula baltica SH 1]|uniref:Uncharacterized protein n=1 Tax=Rhodopirellula baltica (strain DSM 10527 / NCIMB 13988 / SH1) TaxID=243090 RepID=Q7UVV7_RHOBA|nr:hypothetical protein RB2414 [Rhodopirellula baltica SH 1]
MCDENRKTARATVIESPSPFFRGCLLQIQRRLGTSAGISGGRCEPFRR